MNVYFKVLIYLSFLSFGFTLSAQSYLDESFGIEGSVSIPLFDYEDIRLMGQDSTGHIYLQSDTDDSGSGAATLIKLDSSGEIITNRALLSTDRLINFYLKDNTIYSKDNLEGSTIIDAFNLDLSNKSHHIIPEEFVSNVYFYSDNSILGITSRVESDIVTAFQYSAEGTLDKTFGEEGLIEVYEKEAYARLHRHTNGQLYILTSKYPRSERVILRRYDETGQKDTSIGEAGALKLDIHIEAITSSLLRSIKELSDGSLLISYILYDEELTNYLAYAKYDENGIQDMKFGINGYLGTINNNKEFGYTSRFITQTVDNHLLFHYTSRDEITNVKSDFLSLYDLDGNKIKAFANNGVLELTDLPDHIKFNVSAHNDGIYLDYETGIREEGEPFRSTAQVISKLDLSEYLEAASQINSDAFRLFPNPFSGTLTLENYGAKVEDFEISIYDMIGRKVKHIFLDEFRRNQIMIDLPELTSGLYIIQIIIDGEVVKVDLVMNNSNH